eukprot:TRINITY_DN66447_c9_g7_i2.p1 TRINITY_DN66447_c9_g7~~TRINITY_DN66447_c9_g7_i2.p1  ORF type:complete len:1150 (+),score=740.55 TRINITY_DN66447_c9_g7_i2:403-3450(+)
MQAMSQGGFMSKLNQVLVEIVKHEWPHNWMNFIPDLVNSSKTSESLCENNMSILKLLSEEVFDYSSNAMIHQKVQRLKKSLNEQFTLIFQLCDLILDRSQDAALLKITLKALQGFLRWIPIGYIFETQLIDKLAGKFFPADQFQNLTLQCLAEIGGLDVKDHPQYNQKLVQLYVAVTQSTAKLLTPQTDVAKIYASGQNKAQEFVRYLTIFLCSFLKRHLSLLENGPDQVRQVLATSLTFLLRMSEVDDDNIFTICLEYWNVFVSDLYHAQRGATQQNPVLLLASNPSLLHNQQSMAPRVRMYANVLSRLRLIMIAKMAKPEEVLIEEDEDGEIIRERIVNTDAINLYKNMRECMIYLTHLDTQDTRDTMLLKLSRQVDGSEYSWKNLNTLCWAIGSISGAMSEQNEKTFLVRVIKDLLGLVEIKRGKNEKAVIASNIMYVVGQYPRFLRKHWRFLKTVVNKLFEFMHEKHPGVQDMSCDTFVKIARQCGREFVKLQKNEQRPFVVDIIGNIPNTISDLEPSQVHTFYEGVAIVIKAQHDASQQQRLILHLMTLPNQTWSGVITAANHNPSSLFDLKTVKTVVWVLKTNNRVASAVGSGFSVQLSRIYMEMLKVYQLYSNFMSKKVQAQGVQQMKSVLLRTMRMVKQQALRLIRIFVQSATQRDEQLIHTVFVPKLIAPVLDDYKTSHPACRASEVLQLFAVIIEKLGERMVPHVPRIFESVFGPTLQMITQNFTDNPEHRQAFFSLIRSVNANTFRALLGLQPQQFKGVMDSIVWAFKHLDRNFADTGLNTLLELLDNIKNSDVANHFYKRYFLKLLVDLFGALTDTFHQPGFRLHATILSRMFAIVDSGSITVPLWDTSKQQFANNQAYVRQFVADLLSKSFQDRMNQKQILTFVNGLFENNGNLGKFKVLLRDFLIQLKEFAGQDNSDLFLEESQMSEAERQAREQLRVRSVPGLQYNGPSVQQQQQQQAANATVQQQYQQQLVQQQLQAQMQQMQQHQQQQQQQQQKQPMQ